MWPSCIIRIFRNWNAYFNFAQGFWERSCSKGRSVTLANPKHFNFTPHLFSNVWFHLLHVHRKKLVSHSPLHRSPDYSKYNRMGWWSVTPEPKLCSSNTVLSLKYHKRHKYDFRETIYGSSFIIFSLLYLLHFEYYWIRDRFANVKHRHKLYDTI